MEKAKSTLQNPGNITVYRKAKIWQIVLVACNAFVGMGVYSLMGYANYAGMLGYGITAAAIGVILTATRILDGITDPLLALLYDKVDTKFGRLRVLIAGGFLIEAVALWLMFDGLSFKGLPGAVFVALYVIYVIGYTITNMTAQTIPAILTNDPKQRPMVGIFVTAFNYLVPVVLGMSLPVFVLPMAGGQFNQIFLSMAVRICLTLGAVGVLLVCIGISAFDKPEFYQNIGKHEPLKISDMIAVLKGNRPLQSYIAAQASDKIAQITMSQSVIGTLMGGILIGNMGLSAILNLVGMLPSILFAVLGGRYVGKFGSKKGIVTWTKLCMIIAAGQLVFMIILRYTIGTQSIAAMGIPMIGHIAFTLSLNAAKMCVTTSATSFMADVIDYELDRSGKYVPAVVSGTYSLLDKLISSGGVLLASVAIIACGYSGTTPPQPGDPATNGVFWVTMGVFFGMPLIGWWITLLAMKNCVLTKEEMEAVQHRIAEKKAEGIKELAREHGVQV